MHIETVEYLHLRPVDTPRDASSLTPFKSVVLIDASVSSQWRADVSSWLVNSGCRYMMAWGSECSLWDDSVDCANIELCRFDEIPADQFVMTTWHENESMEEVFWFAKYAAQHASVELNKVLILHISDFSQREELLASFDRA